jgi:1,4-alpha-glucan branching enzyme
MQPRACEVSAVSASPAALPPSIAPAAAQHVGMGAIPYPGGVTFRVWSLFADSVSVAGDFNNWSPTANPMARDGGSNYWSVDVPGAQAGQAYKFYLPYAARPGRNAYRMDPYARSIRQNADSTMNAVIAASDTAYQGASYRTPQWNQAVLYELHVQTFNAAPNEPGTFDTAMLRLPDVAQLGVNAIELMPLGQFSGSASTGYNPGYIFAVDDTFGGADSFRIYANAIHALDIAVVLDVVYNHVDGLDLWQFDGWGMDANQCSYCSSGTNGGIYFFEDSRAHTPWSHARFDTGRPEVQTYLLDNVKAWLELRFLDGLRFDSVPSIRNVQDEHEGYQLVCPVQPGIDLLKVINAHVQSTQGWKITIAEDLQGDDSITAPLDQGGYGFNAQWNDDFCYKIRQVATAPSDAARNMGDLASALSSLGGPNAFRSIVYSENHDKADPTQGGGGRLPAIIGNGQADSWNAKKQSTLAACIVLTTPAIPMLFMGQEFLEYRPFPNYGGAPLNLGEPQPIDWSRKETYNGIWILYRDIVRLRRNWFNNTRGLNGPNIHVLPVFDDNVLVYHRWDQGGAGDDVVVICNFADQRYGSYRIGLPRTGLWRVRFNSDARLYDGYFDDWPSFDTTAEGPALNGMPTSAMIGLGAYTCIVLSQE